MSMHRSLRRSLSLSFLAAVLAIAIPSAAWAQAAVRIGYQKSSTLIAVLKQQGTLEKALADQGVKVSWYEFSSGLPLLEALNIGNVDVSADVADTVPIFAQAAGADLTYYASESPSPSAQAIVVPANSPLKTLADLKGKRVAVTKAAGSHYLLIAALRKAGLQWADIKPAYLTPADGRAALQSGNVDAWVTWEPYVASAQRQQQARILADGRGLASYSRYYLAASDYARANPEVLGTIFTQLQKTGAWVKAHPAEAAKVLGPLWGNLDAATVEAANGRRSYQVQPVTPSGLAEQQKIADAFFQAHLIPKQLNATQVKIWSAPAASAGR